jgi:glucan phosphoethanolaminetransferase (alkaline phosphatase superfamily)
LDAETVIITSDHGNAIGEWGIYGHPIHMPIAELQTVPWIKTTAIDKQSHEPEAVRKSTVDPDIEGRLRQLGYHS